MDCIAVLTSGGDAPGMNAAIRAVVRTALGRGARVFGCQRGYDGLLDDELAEMRSTDVGGIIGSGGTILRTARSKRFRQPEQRREAGRNLRERGIEGLVVIGGDGTLKGARALCDECDFPIMGVPASIDNDLPCTDASIGFDTAVNTALDAVDRVRDTAYSHERVFVIEVMGRRNGFIAVEAGLAGGAEAILIPEVPYDLQNVCDRLKAGHRRGKRSSIIVVAEGAASAVEIHDLIREKTGYDARYLVLGHMQRGGHPTAFDRVLATRLGAAAANRLLNGTRGEMVGVRGNQVISTPFEIISRTERRIDPERLLLAEVMAQ
ncbi:MAG: 6-phosphofructokinase [Armatimonadetes bacterium]|nr:6-phosphofructokinase [Armatimonadota bacterium]